MKISLSRNGIVNGNGKFDWVDAVIDAVITAGITAMALGVAMTSTGAIYTLVGQMTYIFTVGGQFLTFLALKRKLAIPK